ncbi:hypothetical protein UUC_17635 [Rhodanobacter denitrificans]|nr:hypothetical protein UUC_17635 [Rhodanobacter denitrificans]
MVWNARKPAELCYWIGGGLARRVYVAGEPVSRRKPPNRSTSAA